MRFVFMGTPEFSIPALERLIEGGHDVVVVYTPPDRPAGRGQQLVSPPIKGLAQHHNIPVLQPETLKNRTEVERLAGFRPDAIIVVAYGQLLPGEVLTIPEFGCLNIHPSLLPRYRGASPIASAILAGDYETGVTLMLLDEGMDSGPILSQKRIPIGPEDTTRSLETSLAELGAVLLMESLQGWFERRLEPQPQREQDATYTKQISKQDGELDWRLSASELERRVRALHPWPGCYTYWQGKTLKVLEAVSIPRKANGVEEKPGTAVAIPSDLEMPFGVTTGDGILGLRRVQLEGRKAVLATEFLRGQRRFIGERLGPA